MKALLRRVARFLDGLAQDDPASPAPAPTLPSDPARRDAYVRLLTARAQRNTQDQTHALRDLRNATTEALRAGR